MMLHTCLWHIAGMIIAGNILPIASGWVRMCKTNPGDAMAEGALGAMWPGVWVEGALRAMWPGVCQAT